MFRISLMVCVLLTLDVTAKPWSKLIEEALQETIVSLDDKGKMSWVEEVEPPEDMDEIQYIIDPRMKIWNGMTDGGKQPPVPEEDLDELYHPSFIDLQDQSEGFHPVADTKEEPLQGENAIQFSKEPVQDKDDEHHPDVSEVAFDKPEQDLDEVYHRAKEQLDGYLGPLVAEYRRDAEARRVLFETDEVELYQPAQDGHEAEGPSVGRVHLQPEEDLDDLYHKDLPVLQHDDVFPKAAAPVEYPSQRKYTEPEDDLDDLHHQ